LALFLTGATYGSHLDNSIQITGRSRDVIDVPVARRLFYCNHPKAKVALAKLIAGKTHDVRHFETF
jgi:hypothetical protein